MAIRADDLEILNITAKQNSLNWSDIVGAVRMWRKSHNPLTTFFSFRWGHAEGMPSSIADLKRLLDANCPRWENDAWTDGPLDSNCLAAAQLILDDRNRRNSSSTQNPNSISSKIARSLQSALNNKFAAITPSPTGAKTEGTLPSSDERTPEETHQLLNEIKQCAVSRGNYSSHYELFSSLIYIHQNLETICAHPSLGNNLYFIPSDNPQRYTQIPIHMENWRTVNAARKALTQLVHGVITAYLYAKNNNLLRTFFNKTYGGNCIEGRTRSILEWTSTTQLKDVHEAIQDCVEKGEAYLNAYKKPVNTRTMAAFLIKQLGGKKYSSPNQAADKDYFPGMYICSQAKLEHYLELVHSYERPTSSAQAKPKP